MEGNQSRTGRYKIAGRYKSPLRILTGLLGTALRAGHRAQAGEHEAPEAARPLPAATELV